MGIEILGRRRFLTELISATGMLAFSHPSLATETQKVPKGFQALGETHPAPPTVFTDQQGRSLTIQGFSGKVVVINLWATWCAPCVKEMPSLARLSLRLPEDKAVVVAISQDKGGVAVAKPFLERLGVTNLPIYFDAPAHLSRDLGVRGLPTSFIIDPAGRIVSRLEGIIEWEKDEVVNYLKSLIII